MVFTIKNIGGWPDKFQDIVFKSTKASDTSNVMAKIVPLDNSWGKKKEFLKKLCFVLKRGMFSIFLVDIYSWQLTEQNGRVFSNKNI